MFDLPSGRLLALEAALPGLLAEDELRAHGVRAFDPEAAYKLTLEATGSKAAAENARCQRIEQIMRDAELRRGR